MSVENPTTKEIAAIISGQMQAQLNERIPLLPISFTQTLARVLSGVVKLLYNYGAFNAEQQFVRLASFKETDINGRIIIPLVEIGLLVGVGNPLPGTQAELEIDITVFNPNPTDQLPSGTQLINAVNGVTYITIGIVLLTDPLVNATVRAVSDQNDTGGVGVVGNLQVGDQLEFVNPIGLVASSAPVSAIITTGVDGEAEVTYRQRVADRFSKRPQGGAYADYEQWGKEVAGVVNIYPYTNNAQPAIVDVYVEVTTDIDPDGLAPPAILQDVLDSINLDQNGLATRRQVSAVVTSASITRTGFDVDVAGIVVPGDLGTVQNQITTGVELFFLDAEPFIAGLTVGRRKEKITASSLIGLVEDIVTAAGGTFDTATMALTSGGGNITEYTLGVGEKAKNTVVTFS